MRLLNTAKAVRNIADWIILKGQIYIFFWRHITRNLPPVQGGSCGNGTNKQAVISFLVHGKDYDNKSGSGIHCYLGQPRVSIRVIICLESSQLPIGNRLFRVIDFTGDLWIKSQFGGIIKPFHAVLVIAHTDNTDIIRGNEFRELVDSQSNHMLLEVVVSWIV